MTAGAGDLLDLVLDQQLEQTEKLTFEISATSPKAYLVEPDHEIRWRGRRFYIVEIEDLRRGTTTTTSVECWATWYRLAGLPRPGSNVFDSVLPADGLEALLAGTVWTVGTNPGTFEGIETFSMEQQDRSVLQLLRTWARITRRKLLFDGASQTVDLVETAGVNRGAAVRYGKNLKGIRKRTSPPKFTTLYPYGADGLSVAGVNGGSEAVEDFSYYTDQGIPLATARERFTRGTVWSDTTFLRDVDLLAAAEEKLVELAATTVTYEVDVADVSELTGIPEPFELGDTVTVFDPAFGGDIVTIVVRVEQHPKQPWKNRIELSNIPKLTTDPSSGNARTNRSAEWVQFVGRTGTGYQIRNDAIWTTNRIPITFREGGRANFHLDLFAVGVGAGVMTVELIDNENPLDQIFRSPLVIPYTDAERIRATLSWALDVADGQKDYRVRVTTTATGGPSSALGVNVEEDPPDQAAFWILAQGATQQTPVIANSERFDYVSNDPQQFTVPDGVTEVEVEVVGGAGGDLNIGGATGGPGCRIVGRLPVIPGTVFDVYAPNSGRHDGGSWPNGGGGDSTAVGNHGGGGGGSAHFVEEGGSFASAVIVAPGGGGKGYWYGTEGTGGDGGLFAGGDATLGNVPGLGADQFAGGLGGDTPTGDGASNAGGNAADTTSSFAAPGGGGGGGWYGGGGAGVAPGNGAGQEAGGGGGGSGWIRSDVLDVEAFDGGGPQDSGFVEFRWENPEI